MAERNAQQVKKVCGGDLELGNFISGIRRPRGTGSMAARSLLSRIPGVPARGSWPSNWYGQSGRSSSRSDGEVLNPQDQGRKFLPHNGSSVYIDLDHLELCLPEVTSARDHLATTRAMLQIARSAAEDANRKLPPDRTLHVLVNNSDGQGHSYGSHLNLLVTRRSWDHIFHRKLHYLLWLASFQVSNLVLTGQGKVGAENGRAFVPYQISQRADFFETLTGIQTTHHRPIVNARDEPLTGGLPFGQWETPRTGLARLHVIFFDNTLCHVSSLLKVGLMQIVTAMIEAEQVDSTLILDDPVAAVIRYSHDPTLTATARLVSGHEITAVDLQRQFLDRMRAFVDRGDCEQTVPAANEILQLAAGTLQQLADRNWDALAGRLDWVLKRQILQRAMNRHAGLTWDTPQIKQLDHQYGNLDPTRGLYWAYEEAGAVERLVSPGEIERFLHEPPADTRAYARAMLLRRAGGEQVQLVDWDRMQFRIPIPGSRFTKYGDLEMSDPRMFTRADCAALLENADLPLDEILEELAMQETASTVPGRLGSSSSTGQLIAAPSEFSSPPQSSVDRQSTLPETRVPETGSVRTYPPTSFQGDRHEPA